MLTIATAVGVFLTIVDKSISIYNQIKPKASEVPENYEPTKRLKAGFIETNNQKQIAKEIK